MEQPTDEQNAAGGRGNADQSRLKEIAGFEIIAKLGQGGMGAVYKARQKSMDRIVALKVLPPSIAKDALFIERFQGEARASAKLNHAHIVKGHDVGQDPATKLWFFAMEFVDGPSLQQVLKTQGVLEEKKALKIVAEIASALECVAAAGMAHRDIKPDNILVNSSGQAKLADLGLAKDLQDDAGLTMSGQALGTPNYMSPEQIRGESANIDIRTDIYSLGATLFHLVTGEPPFSGETSAVIMTKHLTEAPTKANSVNHNVSASCSKLIERMMQKKIEQRVQTPGEVVSLVKKILSGEDIGRGMMTVAREPIVRGSTTRPRDSAGMQAAQTRAKGSSSKTGIYIGGAALVAIAIGFFAIQFGSGESPKEDNRSLSASSVTANDNRTTSLQAVPAAKPEVSHEAKQQQLEKLISAAQEYEKNNPEQFDKILGLYGKALAALEGSPIKQKFEPELQSVIKRAEKRLADAAAKNWEKMSETADAAVRDGDYDAALKAFAEVPASLAGALSGKATSKIATLRAEGKGKVEPILLQAEQFSAAADPASGLKALQAVEKIQLDPLSARVKELKARLEGELANSEELQRKQREIATGKKLEDYLTRFDHAIMVESTPQKARDVATAASRDSELISVADKAAAMQDVVAAFDEALQAQAAALASLKGKPFAVGKDLGTIEKVEGGIIHVALSLEGGKLTAKKKVAVKDLTDEERGSLFQVQAPIKPAAKVVSAMLKMVAGKEDLNGALLLLDSAGNFPLAARYREIIRIRQVGAIEAAAEKAWPTLALTATKPCTSPEQGKALLQVVEIYLNEHKQTQFVKGKASELDAIWKKANSVIDKKFYLSDLQEIEVSVGYPKFGKHGDLGYEGQSISVYGVPSPNGISTHPPNNGQSHVAYMLDGRYGYFTTRVAVNDSCGSGNRTPIVFKVMGDGKLLWQSQPVQRSVSNPKPPAEACRVDVGGVVKLELIVDCPGTYSHAHAVWLEPLVGTAGMKRK